MKDRASRHSSCTHVSLIPPRPAPTPQQQQKCGPPGACAMATYLRETLGARPTRRMRAIGGATWAAAMGTVRGEGGGCGATVDGTAAGSPTAGSCMNTTSRYNLV